MAWNLIQKTEEKWMKQKITRKEDDRFKVEYVFGRRDEPKEHGHMVFTSGSTTFCEDYYRPLDGFAVMAALTRLASRDSPCQFAVQRTIAAGDSPEGGPDRGKFAAVEIWRNGIGR